ncbi:hypothetical protein ACWT_5803 [Actinoplanes sp. SE50]|uniref:hypothetical protein n=1 Tax=unclassified Actinoplanes TaxID=2626549 RepID=UPI00023EBC06|nr:MULTISPECIES: hypothetical protein [unclassified Actinoplanes]AEV86821.1 hypothetical protein ACPL_5934 [Actinoplanes sp. SE50/110]ATO85218.1 hypothetical protein ACWT_5803 [Actinoplanes sp. SE50]SLM02628.1 hypothetical protein ACSP50_5910 [Actinoplanes sp. SE50/110]
MSRAPSGYRAGGRNGMVHVLNQRTTTTLQQLAGAGTDLNRALALAELAHIHRRLAVAQPKRAAARTLQADLLQTLAELYYARNEPPLVPDGWPVGYAPDVLMAGLRDMVQTDNLGFHRTSLLLIRDSLSRRDPRSAVLATVADALAPSGPADPVPGQAYHSGQAFPRLRPAPGTAPAVIPSPAAGCIPQRRAR